MNKENLKRLDAEFHIEQAKKLLDTVLSVLKRTDKDEDRQRGAASCGMMYAVRELREASELLEVSIPGLKESDDKED